MGRLVINQNRITPDKAKELISVCPFGAISYEGGKLDISAACKMCKLCTKKSDIIEYREDDAKKTDIDKSEWRGICVYADHFGDKLHRVTYELIAKARELSEVTGHPVYALLIGSGTEGCAKRLLHYGVDKVFVYDDPALGDFRIEPYTAVFYDFVRKIKPSSVLVGATNLGRQLAPRIAAKCRAGLTADCTVLEMKENTDLVQIRPAFGGNIMAQIVSTDTRPQFCTVRYKVFSEPKPESEARGETVKMDITPDMLISAIDIISAKEKPKDTDISEADVIVAVGRGASGETMRRYAHA